MFILLPEKLTFWGIFTWIPENLLKALSLTLQWTVQNPFTVADAESLNLESRKPKKKIKLGS